MSGRFWSILGYSQADKEKNPDAWLLNAPAERANRTWGRRGLLRKCISRHRTREGQRLCTNGSDACDWNLMATWVLDMGLDAGKECLCRMVVEYI